MSENEKKDAGRPRGRARKVKVPIRAGDYAFLESVADQTGSSPESVARGFLIKAIWSETVVEEIYRVAREAGAKAAAAAPPENESGGEEDEESQG
jgi:hypothetical protein